MSFSYYKHNMDPSHSWEANCRWAVQGIPPPLFICINKSLPLVPVLTRQRIHAKQHLKPSVIKENWKKVTNFSEKVPKFSWKAFQSASYSYMCIDTEGRRVEERDFNRPSTGRPIRLKTLEMRSRITSINSTAVLVYSFYSLDAAPVHRVTDRRAGEISQCIWAFSLRSAVENRKYRKTLRNGRFHVVTFSKCCRRNADQNKICKDKPQQWGPI
jgi:hypothetical protein